MNKIFSVRSIELSTIYLIGTITLIEGNRTYSRTINELRSLDTRSYAGSKHSTEERKGLKGPSLDTAVVDLTKKEQKC
jgi:hypothetical protein